MKIKTVLRTTCCLCLCGVSMWSTANAGTDTEKNNNNLEETKKQSKERNINFSTFVDDVLAKHPSLISAKAEIDAANLALTGSRKSVYNPELVLEAENAEVSTYQVGIAQTIDWHGKKSAAVDQTKLRLESAKVAYLATYEQTASELLFALVHYLRNRDVEILAKKRVALMQQFVKIASRRKSAGDIGQVEIDTARLAFAEAIMQNSESSSELITSEIELTSITGLSLENTYPFPTHLPKANKTKQNINKLIERHPDVVLAQLKVEMAKSDTHIIDVDRRADPTLGISAGKEDDDALVAFSFSIPLMVRNNFSSNVQASRQVEIQAEQSALSVYRRVSANALLAQERYTVMTNTWQLWETNGKTVLQNHQANLEKLWRAGEINVSEYLVQIKQSLDTQLRGSILQGNVWLAWLEWLNATSQVNTWLKNIKSGEIENE